MTAVLLCYAPEDDEAEDGRISAFRAQLEARVQFVTGRDDVEIVTDRSSVSWSTRWQQLIDDTPDECSLLLAVVTPRWLTRPECRQELERFRNREQAIGRHDLVLGILWYPTPPAHDELTADLARRPLVPWHEHRLEPTSAAAGQLLDEVAERIRAVVGTEPTTPPRSLVVDPVPGRGDHTTISAAIAVAGAGDRILVRPGAYDEGLRLDRPVEIVGDGPVEEIVVQARDRDAVLMATSRARVARLTLRQAGGSGDWYGVDTGTGCLLVEDCIITSESLACVGITGGADPIIRRNVITDGASGGILVHTDGLGTIENNQITGHTLTGIEIASGSDPVVAHNRIADNTLGGVYVHEEGFGSIEDNDIVDNGDAGIEVEDWGDPVVAHNRISGNQRWGIWIYNHGRATLVGNTLEANRPTDLLIEGDAGIVTIDD